MHLLKDKTYRKLLESRATAIIETAEWAKKYAEMEVRKNSLKEEYRRVGELLSLRDSEILELSHGLQQCSEQRLRLSTGLAKALETEAILKKQLTAVQDEIKKLTRDKKGEK